MRIVLLLWVFLAHSSWADVSFEGLKESGLLAAASYIDLANHAGPIAGTHYYLRHQARLNDSSISYFLANKQDVQAIAFRGTSNINEVLIDLDVSLSADAELGILLHKGFSYAARAAFLQLKPHLDKTIPIIITGHSLGGAIAQIVALHLQRDGFVVQQVITFGQPKVTNVAGSEMFDSLPLLRVVTVKDIVPLVPPISPLQIRDLDIYWHSGEELILLAGPNYSIISGFKSMLRATSFAKTMLDESNLDAHMMTTYLNLIEQKLPRSKQVVYKSGINVFGLSFD